MLILQILGAIAVLLLVGIYSRLGDLRERVRSLDKRISMRISDDDVWEMERRETWRGRASVPMPTQRNVAFTRDLRLRILGGSFR